MHRLLRSATQATTLVAQQAPAAASSPDPKIVCLLYMAGVLIGVSTTIHTNCNPRTTGTSGGVLAGYQNPLLANTAEWRGSGFGAFEKFIYEFLAGGGEGGEGSGEGVRLKLQTPLYVAEALLQVRQGESLCIHGSVTAIDWCVDDFFPLACVQSPHAKSVTEQ